MALRDILADAVMVIRFSPYTEPTSEDFDDADYLLRVMLRNPSDLKVWLKRHGFLPSSDGEDVFDVDI